ncbi:MAG: hypothetical protein K2F83_06320 [Oscillospiraceae bacterium]|nr:hypothetical protein [Oscillospiraceae bacterium]
MEKLEKTPQYVYPLWFCLFYFELLPFLAAERGTVSFLRNSVFYVCRRGTGGTPEAHGGFAHGYGDITVLVPIQIPMLGASDVAGKKSVSQIIVTRSFD